MKRLSGVDSNSKDEMIRNLSVCLSCVDSNLRGEMSVFVYSNWRVK